MSFEVRIQQEVTGGKHPPVRVVIVKSSPKNQKTADTEVKFMRHFEPRTPLIKGILEVKDLDVLSDIEILLTLVLEVGQEFEHAESQQLRGVGSHPTTLAPNGRS